MCKQLEVILNILNENKPVSVCDTALPVACYRDQMKSPWPSIELNKAFLFFQWKK